MLNHSLLSTKKALLLDMNGTFMFGEDRFDESEDFSDYYKEIGGVLTEHEINSIIRDVYDYLSVRYTDEKYRENFPSVRSAIASVFTNAIARPLDKVEFNRIEETFAFHELGVIPDEYAAALHQLRQRFVLAAVIDIWAPKDLWLQEFARAGVSQLFTALSFSSDHGMVKPSPNPFLTVLRQLGMQSGDVVMIGDSISRDLTGAHSAGIDCILVGGKKHADAQMSIDNLLQLVQ